MLTWILFAIVAVFIVYEAVAHFLWHNVGMETASRVILNAEQKWGWPVRVLVAAAVIVLGIHLEGVF